VFASACTVRLHTVISLFYLILSKQHTYRAFHRFGQDKFPDGVLVLGLSQFSILLQLPPKILLNSKVVKIDQKISIMLRKSKSARHSIDDDEYSFTIKKMSKLFL